MDNLSRGIVYHRGDGSTGVESVTPWDYDANRVSDDFPDADQHTNPNEYTFSNFYDYTREPVLRGFRAHFQLLAARWRRKLRVLVRW